MARDLHIDQVLRTVLSGGWAYPDVPEVLAIGHIFIALSQAHEVSILELINTTVLALNEDARRREAER